MSNRQAPRRLTLHEIGQLPTSLLLRYAAEVSDFLFGNGLYKFYLMSTYPSEHGICMAGAVRQHSGISGEWDACRNLSDLAYGHAFMRDDKGMPLSQDQSYSETRQHVLDLADYFELVGE
jgi:hypothetical protein